MKKIFSCIIAAMICLLYMPFEKAAAAENGAFVYTGGFDIDAFLREFSTEYINRSAITYEKEYAAADFIAGKFLELNLSPAGGGEGRGNYLHSFNFSYSRTSYNSNNVIGIKPAAQETALSVIIGAHYDNVYDYTLTNPYTDINYNTQSNGAYDNGSGISVLLSVANNILEEQLPFNVIFIAFGAEEPGMYGSRHYAENLNETERENILLMVNLDSISAGDYLYLFSRDYPAGHDAYLREAAKELSIPLRSMPFDKKYMSDPFNNKFYSHTGYYSDNYYFLEAGINTAFFLTLNFESFKKAGVVESDSNSDIIHTSDDNYTNLKELYPETYLLHMQYVSELVAYTLKKPDFIQAMVDSRNNSPDYSFITNSKYLTLMSLAVWLAFAAFAWFYYGRLKKVSSAKIKEYINDPENAGKIHVIIKNMPPNMPPFNNMPFGNIPPGAPPYRGSFTYPPHTYKPKNGEDEFSVFGKDYENPEDKDVDNGGSGNENKENKD